MSTEIKRPRAFNKNRVKLSEECSARIEAWTKQVGDRFKGMAIKPSDLVEWLILGHAERLESSELADLQKKYWDDIAMAAWALKELKRAKSQGAVLSLSALLSHDNSLANKDLDAKSGG